MGRSIESDFDGREIGISMYLVYATSIGQHIISFDFFLVNFVLFRIISYSYFGLFVF